MNIQELQEKAVHIIDLYAIHDEKLGQQKTSTDSIVMQFVSDVGDLSRYITKKERGDDVPNFDESISRELAESLSHVFVLAHIYNVNLEEAFLKENSRLEKELS